MSKLLLKGKIHQVINSLQKEAYLGDLLYSVCVSFVLIIDIIWQMMLCATDWQCAADFTDSSAQSES